jgi:hypothetical protein
VGAVTDGRWSAFERTCAEIGDARSLLQSVSLSPQACFPKLLYDRLYMSGRFGTPTVSMSNAMVYSAGVSFCTPQCQNIVSYETDILVQCLRVTTVPRRHRLQPVTGYTRVGRYRPFGFDEGANRRHILNFPNMCSC